MSILWQWDSESEGDYRPHEVLAEDLSCFLCYHPLHPPIIHWMGSHGNIYLHPGCVLNLAVRMFRDVHEVQIKQGDTPEVKA